VVEIVGENCLTGWQAGVRLLTRAGKHTFNLVTTIQDPTSVDPSWLIHFDPRAHPPGTDKIKDVINTIFPVRLASTLDRKSLYERYLQIHDRARGLRRNSAAWGTYFERLIRFGRPSGSNQLEILIEKLTKWDRRAQAALVLHLSAPSLDTPRDAGWPLLAFW
jgi:hypothetical protein